MPTPTQNETQQEFVSRCIPIVIEDGTASDADQATAVCYSMWEEREKEATVKHEYKTLEFKLSGIDPTGRTIEGYAAAFHNIDQGADIIHPGAFTKTLAERGNKVRLLWQHDRTEPIGKPIELREDAEGLYMKAVISDTQRGRDLLALLRDSAIDGMSIGYDAIPGGIDYTRDGDKTIRNLREIKLYEVSLVTFPMNESARVTALKLEDDPADEKAGRRMRGDKAELVRKIRGLLSELAAWVDYEDGEPEAEPDEEPEKQACDTVQDQKANEAGPESVATETPPTWEAERIALLAEIETIK